MRQRNDEVRKLRRIEGPCKNCANERNVFEDKLRKLTCEAEGATNLVVEIRRASKEELAQEKQRHDEDIHRLELENDALCECNKSLRAQIGR